VSEALLEVDGLEAGYGDVVVLHGVSLRVAAGELVCIVGPNGAGKSTLLKAVYGLVRRSSGSIRLAGEEIGDERPDRLTRRGLNLVPQIDNVFPSLTVRENLKVGVLGAPKSERAARSTASTSSFRCCASARGSARAPSRAASASSSRSPARSSRRRACCCWTSPLPAWRRRPSTSSSPSSPRSTSSGSAS
jgi:ABC-type sugar transport system ATPase subunit